MLDLSQVLGVIRCSLLGFLFCLRGSLSLRLSTCGSSFLELLCLCFLLSFDELTLGPLGICLNRFVIVFVLTGRSRSTFLLFVLGTVSLFVIVLRRGKPADELGEEGPHRVLGFPIEENTVFIHTQTLGMPLNEELILHQAVIVKLLAKCGSKLLHLRVKVDEELADSLEEVLDAVCLFLGNQLRKYRLKGVPMLDNVAVGAENTLHRDEHLVITRHVQLELKLAHFTEDIIGATSARISFLFRDKVLELFARLSYMKIKMQKSELA